MDKEKVERKLLIKKVINVVVDIIVIAGTITLVAYIMAVIMLGVGR